MSMIRITISTGNEAFGCREMDGSQDTAPRGAEVARILRDIATQFELAGTATAPRDINNNTVGAVETIE